MGWKPDSWKPNNWRRGGDPLIHEDWKDHGDWRHGGEWNPKKYDKGKGSRFNWKPKDWRKGC